MSEMRWHRVYNMDGGVNDWAAEEKLQDNEASVEENVRLDEGGFIQKRHGNTIYGGATDPYAAKAVDGLFRAVSDLDGYENLTAGENKSTTQNSVLFLGLQDADLVYGTDADGSFTKEADIASATRARFVQWRNNRVYIGITGCQHSKRYGLNTAAQSTAGCYDMNIPSIAIGTMAGSNGSGDGTSTVGHYCCGVSGYYGPYLDDDGRDQIWAESKVVRTASFEVDTVGNDYVLANIPTTGGYALACKAIYMTEPQTSGAAADVAPLFHVKDHNMATDAFSWSDEEYPTNLTRPALTSEETGSIRNLQVRYLAVHNDRLWCNTNLYKDDIEFSNAGRPDEYGDYNDFRIKYECTGLIQYRGSLVIAMEPEIHIMRGWSPEEFGISIETAVNNRGCIAPDSLAVVDVGGTPMLFFVGYRRYGEAGIYAYDGHETHHIGRKVQGEMAALTSTQIGKIRAINHGGRYIIGLGDDDTALCYDADRNTWHPWTGLPIGALAVWNNPADDGELYWGQSTTGGLVKKADATGYDTCTFKRKTRYFAPEGKETWKSARMLLLTIEKDSLPISYKIYADNGREMTGDTIPGFDTDEGWGSGTWANIKWERAGSDMITITIPLKPLQFRSYALEFESYHSDNVKILGASLGYMAISGRGSR